MDLRNGRITVGEIIRNPNARAILRCVCPVPLNSPFIRRFYGMHLETAIGYAGRYLSQGQLHHLLARLKEV